jgi:hypothetical protein
VTAPASRSASLPTPRRTAIGPVPRWLVVSGAAPGPAVVGALADEPAAEPGTSVAAYER